MKFFKQLRIHCIPNTSSLISFESFESFEIFSGYNHVHPMHSPKASISRLPYTTAKVYKMVVEN